jgi:hypothetical protein
MKHPAMKKYFQNNRLQRVLLTLFVLVVGMVGGYLYGVSHAKTPALGVEAESGAASNGASPITDSTASNHSAIKFVGNGPSGQLIPQGNVTSNGHLWTQNFSEDFTTAAPLGSFDSTYASKFGSYGCGVKDTSKNGTYCDAKVLSVAGGVMDYFVHTEGTTHYTAAPIPRVGGTTKQYGGGTGAKGGQLYGRYSLRFKSDQVYGYKIAWLLWPDSNVWPADGETDFPEGNLDGTISAVSHYANANGKQVYVDSKVSMAGWHTTTVEWAPGVLRFYLDNTLVLTNTTDVPSKPMYWSMQTETNLDGSEPVNNTASGHIKVDWITAYSY